MSRRPPVVLLMGPTASGKTELAVELVSRMPLDIISVDSGQVYRGMDIGTAKPGPEVLAAAPHRLIDICDPADSYSAARFGEDALREIDDILAAGRTPLLAGGTMLYFRALTQGLSELPAADAGVRARLDAEARDGGWAAMHARLEAVDPAAAARIHPNDPQRIQRALEVYELSGVPMTELLAAGRSRVPPYEFVRLALVPEDRESLRRRIESRFRGMLGKGLVEEVQALRRREDLDLGKPSIRTVGYRQIWQYLDGDCGYDEMVERGIVATRQLAKRQLTWLRAEQGLALFHVEDRRNLAKVLNYLASVPIC